MEQLFMILPAIKISLICFMFTALGDPDMIFSPYQKFISRLPDWLNKPLGTCVYCFTGQVALWYFVITKPFDIIELLFFVSLSIFLTSIYSILWNYE